MGASEQLKSPNKTLDDNTAIWPASHQEDGSSVNKSLYGDK